MCAVSNVGDNWSGKFPKIYPGAPWEQPINPYPGEHQLDREELERLRKDVEEMKRQLKEAQQQDIENGEPDCEMEEKVELLKIAEFIGVSLDDIWPEKR